MNPAPPAPSRKIFESFISKFLFLIGSKNPSMSVLYPFRTPSEYVSLGKAVAPGQFSLKEIRKITS